MSFYCYEFALPSAVHDIFAELLAGEEKKEAFLSRLKDVLRDSARIKDVPITKLHSPFYGKRYLDFEDEYIGWCRVTYDVPAVACAFLPSFRWLHH